jgi:hypothetical protein
MMFVTSPYTLTFCAAAVLARGLRQSQTSVDSCAYKLRCAINTVAKRAFAFVFQKTLQGCYKWGSFFTTTVLENCLKHIAKQPASSPVHICTSASHREAQLDLDYDIPSTSSLFAYPVVVEGTMEQHITLFFVEKKGDQVSIEFYDSKALAVNHPKNQHAQQILSQLQEKFPSNTLKQLTRPIQFDGHNCGAYVCWFMEQRLAGKTFEEIRDGAAPDIEQYRQQLIKTADQS